MKAIFMISILTFALSGCSPSAEVLVTNRISHDPSSGTLFGHIGLETLGGVFTPLLEGGCKLPCEVTRVFSTAEDGQSQITIVVYSGDTSLVSEAEKLGRFEISGITPAPRGEPAIEVTFLASRQGLRLRATDKTMNSTLVWKRLE